MGYMNPYLYMIFILYLPVSISRSNTLIIGFLMGLCIAIFENSGGIHAAATTLLAYIRPFLLRAASRRQGTDLEDLSVKNLNLPALILYALAGIFIHHLAIFSLEAFDWNDIGIVLVRTLYSTLFTFIFVLIYQFWNFRRRV